MDVINCSILIVSSFSSWISGKCLLLVKLGGHRRVKLGTLSKYACLGSNPEMDISILSRQQYKYSYLDML